MLAASTEAGEGSLTDGDLLQSEAIGRLQAILPRYRRLLFDAGNCAASALHYLSVPDHVETSIALGMGGMGYAIPAAIGASFSGEDVEHTMVLCGDGAFLMLGTEVHTAVDLGLPILFVVFNNSKHGMCVTPDLQACDWVVSGRGIAEIDSLEILILRFNRRERACDACHSDIASPVKDFITDLTITMGKSWELRFVL